MIQPRAAMSKFLLLLVSCQMAGVLSISVFGGLNTIRVDDFAALEAANFAVGKLNMASNSDFALVLTSLVSGTKQVVAGIKYDLTIKVSVSQDCPNKGKPVSLENCRPDMRTANYFNVQVLKQTWMTPGFKLLDTKQLDVEDDESQFQNFVSEYQKSYFNNVSEYEERLVIFRDNLREIALLQENEQGSATYGVNEFADISKEEFLSHRAMPGGWGESMVDMPMAPELALEGTPDSFDWRSKGVVTEIKNQGSCGSCWAFSTTGNIEGQWAIHHGKLISLSEQELVDCDKVDQGCKGGLPSTAYQQIMKLGGLETESDYPYRAENMKCRFESSKVVVNITGFVKISEDEDQMAAWLATNGPISIGINAAVMQHYIGGISDPFSLFCSPHHLDHGVLIVGYGEEGDRPFWIIKNSWGQKWGEQGYYRIIRGKGKCGLNKMPTSATV